MSGIDSELIRGHIDTIILKTLDGSSKYGYEICHDVETVSNGEYELKQPTLYSCLKRLEDKGLISSYWEDSDIGGRRHYYKLTSQGKQVYNENIKHWIISRDIIDSLILDNTTPSYSSDELVEIDADLIRGNIDTIILKTLSTGAKYGYDICRDVEEKSNKTYELKQPTLYSCLKRLEDKGLISSYWEDSDIGGRRHYYKLTEQGNKSLAENQQAWQDSKELINRLIFNAAHYTQHVMPAKNQTSTPSQTEPETITQEQTVEKTEQETTETFADEELQEVAEIDEKEVEPTELENEEQEDNEVEEDDEVAFDEDETEDDVALEDEEEQESSTSQVDDAWFTDDEPTQQEDDEEQSEEENVTEDESTEESSQEADPLFNEEDEEDEEEIEDTAAFTNEAEETQEETTPENTSFFMLNEDDADCKVDIPQTSNIYRERELETTQEEETETSSQSLDDFLQQNEANYAQKVSQQNQENVSQEDLFDSLHFSSLTDEISPLQEETTPSQQPSEEPSTIFIPDVIEETSDSDFDIHSYVSQNNSYQNAKTEEQNITFAPKAKTQTEPANENTTYTFYQEESSTPFSFNEEEDKEDTFETNETASNSFNESEEDEEDHTYDDEIFLDYKPKTNQAAQPENTNVEKPLYTATYTEKEYRDALDKLSAYTKAEEPEDRQNLQNTEKTSLEALQTKLEQKGITLSIYKRGVCVPEATKNYILSNKIKMVRSFITLCFMSFLLALTYISLQNYGYVNQEAYATNTYFIVAFALICIPPIFATIRYAIQPMQKHVARFAPRISFLFALLFTVQILVIIYSVNLQLGFTSFTQTNYNHLNWIVPCVLTLQLFVDSIVYTILYKSKRFHR